MATTINTQREIKNVNYYTLAQQYNDKFVGYDQVLINKEVEMWKQISHLCNENIYYIDLNQGKLITKVKKILEIATIFYNFLNWKQTYTIKNKYWKKVQSIETIANTQFIHEKWMQCYNQTTSNIIQKNQFIINKIIDNANKINNFVVYQNDKIVGFNKKYSTFCVKLLVQDTIEQIRKIDWQEVETVIEPHPYVAIPVTETKDNNLTINKSISLKKALMNSSIDFDINDFDESEKFIIAKSLANTMSSVGTFYENTSLNEEIQERIIELTKDPSWQPYFIKAFESKFEDRQAEYMPGDAQSADTEEIERREKYQTEILQEKSRKEWEEKFDRDWNDEDLHIKMQSKDAHVGYRAGYLLMAARNVARIINEAVHRTVNGKQFLEQISKDNLIFGILYFNEELFDQVKQSLELYREFQQHTDKTLKTFMNIFSKYYAGQLTSPEGQEVLKAYNALSDTQKEAEEQYFSKSLNSKYLNMSTLKALNYGRGLGYFKTNESNRIAKYIGAENKYKSIFNKEYAKTINQSSKEVEEYLNTIDNVDVNYELNFYINYLHNMGIDQTVINTIVDVYKAYTELYGECDFTEVFAGIAYDNKFITKNDHKAENEVMSEFIGTRYEEQAERALAAIINGELSEAFDQADEVPDLNPELDSKIQDFISNYNIQVEIHNQHVNLLDDIYAEIKNNINILLEEAYTALARRKMLPGIVKQNEQNSENTEIFIIEHINEINLGNNGIEAEDYIVE